MYIEPAPLISFTDLFKRKNTNLLFHELTNKAIQRGNEDYEYWSKFKRRPFPEGLEPDYAWAYLKWLRRTNGVKLRLNNIGDILYYATDNIQERLHKLDSRLGGTIGFGEEFNGQHRQKYLVNSMMEEAIASSQLEGASTARKIAKTMLRTGRTPRTNSERMIANNYKAMQFVVENTDQPITPEYLTELHGIATSGTLDDPNHEGVFRKGAVEVYDSTDGTIVHNAPNISLLPELIDHICNVANDSVEGRFVHPLAKASILHFLIGYVHPFEDGNGRTARAMMYGYMTRHNYWLTEFLVISKSIAKSRVGYDKAYLHTEHDGLDVTYFVHYMLKAISTAVDQLEGYINKKIRIRRSNLEQMAQTGLNERQVDVLRQIERDPLRVFTVSEYAHEFNVTLQTARADLKQLVSNSYLLEFKQGRKAMFKRALKH